MASSFSTNLAFELLGLGDQSGTWGNTANTNLGTLVEQAISGYVTQAITDGSGANTTLTMSNGASCTARNMFLELNGALTFDTCSLIVPANKKLYFIYNNTTGGHPVTVKVSGLTGVAVPNGCKVLLVCNGTDIVEAHNAIVGNATVGGTLAVTGATALSGGINLTSAAGTSYVLGSTASTFTFNGSGGTSGSVTMTWEKIGSLVRLTIPAVTATTGTNSKIFATDTLLPAAIRPSNTQASIIPSMLSNGANVAGYGYIGVYATGVINILLDSTNTTNFTNSASGGVGNSFTFSYYLQ